MGDVDFAALWGSLSQDMKDAVARFAHGSVSVRRNTVAALVRRDLAAAGTWRLTGLGHALDAWARAAEEVELSAFVATMSETESDLLLDLANICGAWTSRFRPEDAKRLAEAGFVCMSSQHAMVRIRDRGRTLARLVRERALQVDLDLAANFLAKHYAYDVAVMSNDGFDIMVGECERMQRGETSRLLDALARHPLTAKLVDKARSECARRFPRQQRGEVHHG